MKLYKGYIKTKGKAAVEPFKNRSNFKSYEEVKNEDSFAGVLAENTILIDIDDQKESEILLRIVDDLHINCRVIKTNRGRHFLFQNAGVTQCMTHVQLAVGLTADIKVGSKNSYEVLKINGKERPKERDRDHYDTLPKWLLPVRTTKRFLKMEEGDGRNSAFYSYIPVLQGSGFTIEEVKETIGLINRYIVKTPLPSSELKVVLRDDAFEKISFFEGKRFLFDKFAKYLVDKYHIKKINGGLHTYVDNTYKEGYIEIESLIIKEIPDISQAKRKEVLSYLEILLKDNVPMSPPNLISFTNGIYDIEKDILLPPSPEYIIPNRIPFDYNPCAYHELLDKTLDKISKNDKTIRANLEESVGYMMFRRNELGKAFILTGEGSNGKSTWLNLLKYTLGEENYSALDLKKISDRFSTVMIFGKLANIGDDISSGYIKDVSDFRKIVTGETIDAEEKGRPKFQFNPYTKLFFSSNSIPRLGRGRDFAAIKRRLIIIPFKAKFSPNDKDFVPYISDKLQTKEAAEYLIRLGIRGLKRILRTNTFTTSAAAEKEMEEYEELANPIIGFIKEQGDKIENELIIDVFRKYEIYCTENNLVGLGRNQFTNSMCKLMGMKYVTRRIHGKREQLFVRA